MAYNEQLANRIRKYLLNFPDLDIHEKEMFGGLTFMVNGKMCITVSHANLLCRFNPLDYEKIAERSGFQPMIMKGKILKNYCYVSPEGFASRKDFIHWVNLCLAYNAIATSSKKKKTKT